MLKSGDPGAMLASGQTGAVLAVWKSGDKLTNGNRGAELAGRESREREGGQKEKGRAAEKHREGRQAKMGRTTENMGHRNRKKSAETMGKQTARAGQTGGQEETNRDLPLISSHRQNRKTTFSSFFLCFFSQKTRERSENPKI